jgi:fumarate hydratase class II
MVCAQVMGNDVAITVGGMQHYRIKCFQTSGCKFLTISALLGDTSLTNIAHRGLNQTTNVLQELVDNSLMLVTALNTKIGYYKSAEIAQTAHKNGTTLKEEAVRLGYVTQKILMLG